MMNKGSFYPQVTLVSYLGIHLAIKKPNYLHSLRMTHIRHKTHFPSRHPYFIGYTSGHSPYNIT